jgi:hypothetical protein
MMYIGMASTSVGGAVPTEYRPRVLGAQSIAVRQNATRTAVRNSLTAMANS